MDFSDGIQESDFSDCTEVYPLKPTMSTPSVYPLRYKRRERLVPREEAHQSSQCIVPISRVPEYELSGSNKKFIHQSRHTFPNILALPIEMLQLILLRVCRNSFRDLCRAQASCTTFRDVTNDGSYYKEVDLFGVEFPDVYRYGVAMFMLTCEEHGNLSAMFIRGTSEYFREGRLEEGLAMIRDAACKGYDVAKYAYANIKRIMSPGDGVDSVLLSLDRAFVCRMRRRVESTDIQGWPYNLPLLFDKACTLIPTCDLYACGCSPHRNGIGQYNEAFESPHMCDSCFWIIHMLFFYGRLYTESY